MAQRQRRDERFITVVETREFQQRAATRMSEEERQNFITFIAEYPEDGSPDMPIFLLTVFAKNERENLSQREKNSLKQLVTELIKTYEAR